MAPMPVKNMPIDSRQAPRRQPPRHTFHAVLMACLLCGGVAQAETGRLVIEVQNIRDDSGQIRASIYRDPDSFRKEDRALKVLSLPARPGQASLSLDGLPPGRYAVMVYHDANADQTLNLRLGMFPTEGYGLSNNPKVMGPPRFADSAFEVAGPETAIDIRLAY